MGLSGGVDSAVSAALLKEQGHDVVGVFIKIWQPEFVECTWKEDRLDAMRVCVALGIPFHEIDLSDEYKKEVVKRMVFDYARGITPNPDVLCNRHIKFGAFAKWAYAEGAEAIATGHYARTQQADGHYRLLRGKDAAKDQSYFLYRLDRHELARVHFPVGELTKPQVRAAAKRFDLPVAQKPDSQGLCFVGEVSMRNFLSRYIPVEEGAVIDMQGKTIGKHQGAAFYTLGQRHGFEAATGNSSQGPAYVVSIEVATNTLRVSPRRGDAERRAAALQDEHWVNNAPAVPARLEAQTRYHEKPVLATLAREHGRLIAMFDEPHIASPGQSMVLYDGDVVVGGGIIAS